MLPINNISIRPASPTDFDAIYTFVCGLENKIFDKEIIRRCYDTNLAGKDNYYLIAEDNGKPIGYLSCHGQILLHHAGMVYEIQEFYIDEAYRSHGIGKKMLAVLEETLSHTSYELLEVASNMKRVDAHRFYENNGFDKNTFKFNKEPVKHS